MEGNPHLRVPLPKDALHMCQVDKTKPDRLKIPDTLSLPWDWEKRFMANNTAVTT